MAAHGKSMEARTGRTKQRYSEEGARLVAGIVALSPARTHVLLIESSRRPNAWVLPKGGWESDEATAEDAAQREAWEEAGITGKIVKSLGKIKEGDKAVYMFFEMGGVVEGDEWPEMGKRRRKWVGYKEAMERFERRPELRDALDRSGIVKT